MNVCGWGPALLAVLRPHGPCLDVTLPDPITATTTSPGQPHLIHFRSSRPSTGLVLKMYPINV